MVLVVLLASVATLAVWRTRDIQQQHQELEHTSTVALALEHAQAQFQRELTMLSALVFSDDPALLAKYQDAAAAAEQHLNEARAAALAEGEPDEAAVLGDLAERVSQFNEKTTPSLAAEADPAAAAQSAIASMAQMVPEADAIIVDLEELAHEAQQELAAATAAADRTADTTLWLLIGFSAAAFLVAVGAIAMLIVSVIRPLAALRASARAITSGDPEARAKMSGPEEVASLARDFNEMTDALLARTQEREKALHDMGERMKELACIYRVADLARADKSIEELLQDAVIAIPPGWHYPEITRAKLSFDGQEYVSQPFEETPWKQSSDIVIRGEKRGAVEVCYLEERPELDEGPFLKEERRLIDGIARILSEAAERKRAEEALRESEERYRDLFENATDLVQSVRQDGSLVYVNRAWRQALGYREDEIAALSLFDIIHPDSKAHCMKIFQRVMAGETLDPIETMFLTKDGRTIWVEGSASCRFEDGEPVTTRGIFHDITERKKAEEERARLNAELEVRAITDGLTGLYNHAHFFQRLAEEVDRSNRYGRGFAVVMMDVDNFKQFNDTRGHQAGDEALCLIADCIRKAIRRSDIAFRYGGDEFAAIVLHADSPRAQAVAKRVKRCITRRLQEASDPAAAWLGLSAGVACFPDDATTVDDLVRIADTALYDAKRAAQARRPAERAPAAAQLAAARATAPTKR
jgi:diguanylate cyclase (GGDEF)-like protein/PAS domain S-box-containing protein